MNCGIYVIENLINGKKYVGQSINLNKRMNEYHYRSVVLNRAIKKYGEKNFKRYILVYCEIFELDRLEKAYIEILKSHMSKNGYNMSFGGEACMRGRSHSKKTKKMYSEIRKGKYPSEETKKKMSDVRLGKTRSESAKNNISLGKVNKKMKKSASSYFGVSKNTKEKYVYWRARVSVDKKNRLEIGHFKTELDAAHAYDEYIIKHNLSNPLNFIKTAP